MDCIANPGWRRAIVGWPWLLAVVGAGHVAAWAEAPPIYRCGNHYSHTPCPAATRVDASDERGPAQRAEAQEVADRERRLAESMQADRVAAEHAGNGGRAISLDPLRAEAARKPASAAVRTPRPRTATRHRPTHRHEAPSPRRGPPR